MVGASSQDTLQLYITTEGMMRERRRNFNLDEIARRIEAARRSPIGEPATFDAVDIHLPMSALESGIEFQPDVAEADWTKVIWKAVSETARTGIVDSGSLRRHLQQAEIGYLKQPIQGYVLATSIRINYFDQLKRIGLDDAIITFSRNYPKQFTRTALEPLMEHRKLEQPAELTCVRVYVRARTANAAAQHALSSLDLVRGLWNYSINRRTFMSFNWGGSDEPVNKIVLGPIHTIHNPKGELATEKFWYVPPWRQSEKVFDLARDWDYVRESSTNIRRRLKHIRYEQLLKDLFVRYTRALDLTDYSTAFYKLWSILEHLTSSVGQYDRLISRTAFLIAVDEQDYVRLILEHLRDVRNGFIHDDRAREETRSYIYQLKMMVEMLFLFHLSQGNKFESIGSAGEFLDLPSDVNVLKQRIHMYNKALSYRTPR